MLAITNDTFDPVALSLEENAFLIEHLGKPPKVVSRVAFPAGVNPKAVMPVIEDIYALLEIEKHDQEAWTGVDVIKARCRTYIEQRERWAEMKQRGGVAFPKFPSMAGWDGRGKPHLGAVGSDAQTVRTYFDDQGDRQPFAVSLHDDGIPAFAPPWVKRERAYDALIVEDGSVTCPICKHAETWEPSSQSAHNMAMARMSKHLVSAKREPDVHKALHTKVFGG
jgi:hypothetical protein